jgi:hypothetical protein
MVLMVKFGCVVVYEFGELYFGMIFPIDIKILLSQFIGIDAWYWIFFNLIIEE